MKRKGWLIPIIIFLISITFLLSYQQGQTVLLLADTTALPPIIWSEKSSDIVRVIYSTGDKTVEAAREDENWTLTSGDARSADALYIYKIITPFLEPLFEQIIEANPVDLTTYGIDDLSPSFTLCDAAGHEYTLIKGNEANDTTDYVYAPLSQTVYTMDKDAFSAISTSNDNWESKELLDFEINNINKIDLVYKGHSATLIPVMNEEGITFNSSQLEDRVVNEFITFLQTTKIKSFITDEANEHVLNVYGFNSPMLKCTLFLKDGTKLSLTIGNVNEDENICYTQINTRKGIVSIPYFNLSQFNLLYSQLQNSNSYTIG